MDKHTLYIELEKAYKNLYFFSDETKKYFSEFLIINKNYQDLISSEDLSSYLIKILDSLEPEYSNILHERYLKRKSALLISQTLFLSKDQVNRYKRTGLNLLSEFMIAEEKNLRYAINNDLLKSIPYFDNVFFGHADDENFIYKFLNDKSEKNKLVITGIGGIGKSTILNKTMRNYFKSNNRYNNIIWIRIPNDTIDKLKLVELLNHYIEDQQILNTVLIIDNINLKVEFQIIDNYLKNKKIINSKIVFTSRYRPIKNNDYDELWISEIEKHEYYLYLNKISKFSISENQIYDQIYNLIGGNPLAIKITNSLFNIFSPEVIIDNFYKLKINTIEDMFNFIFLKAWETLNNNAKACLLLIPIFKDTPITIYQIAKISGIDVIDVISAISVLYERSLIEVRGGFDQKQYGIHYLTYTFLKEKEYGL